MLGNLYLKQKNCVYGYSMSMSMFTYIWDVLLFVGGYIMCVLQFVVFTDILKCVEDYGICCSLFCITCILKTMSL